MFPTVANIVLFKKTIPRVSVLTDITKSIPRGARAVVESV
jgi:hypothetical protein